MHGSILESSAAPSGKKRGRAFRPVQCVGGYVGGASAISLGESLKSSRSAMRRCGG